jgi:16S rRNA (guanine1207-N2)-methyltransferase
MNTEKQGGEHYYTRRPKSKPQLGVIRTRLRGHVFEFVTSASVFSKKRVDLGTRLLIESMILPEEGLVLDLGCGYGPVGIVVAALNPSLRVVMTDLNKRAVWLARKNAKLNKVDNTEVRRGLLYDPVENMKFDAILVNPPVSAGKQAILSIINGAREHLREGRLLQLVVSSKIAGSYVLKEAEKTFSNVAVSARKGGYKVLLSKKP